MRNQNGQSIRQEARELKFYLEVIMIMVKHGIDIIGRPSLCIRMIHNQLSSLLERRLRSRSVNLQLLNQCRHDSDRNRHAER